MHRAVRSAAIDRQPVVTCHVTLDDGRGSPTESCTLDRARRRHGCVILGARTIADSNEALHRRQAAAWFDAAQRASRGGNTETAVAGLRRAVLKDPENSRYRLALAQALAASHLDEATRVLLALREHSPRIRTRICSWRTWRRAASDADTGPGCRSPGTISSTAPCRPSHAPTASGVPVWVRSSPTRTRPGGQTARGTARVRRTLNAAVGPRPRRFPRILSPAAGLLVCAQTNYPSPTSQHCIGSVWDGPTQE